MGKRIKTTTNIYQITVGFLNPSTANIMANGDSEKEVKEKVLFELKKQFVNPQILSVTLLDTIPTEKAEVVEDNIIQFPKKPKAIITDNNKEPA